MQPVFTIGHSNHQVDALLALLSRHSVTAVADVRSQPYSRLHPQFNRDPLRSVLRSAGLSYVFLGRELGARSEDPSCYLDGVVQYDRVAATELFKHGLERVLRGAATHRIALLCAERDPLTCHRTILVGRQLVATGADLRHIRETGLIEDHKQAMDRLLVESGLQSREFFRSHAEIQSEAYARRAREIAYRLQEQPMHATENL